MLKYDKQRKRLVNIAVDNRSSPFYALRDRQGNAIGVTACDIDGDGREEIYVLNTNNAFSGTVQAETLLKKMHTSTLIHSRLTPLSFFTRRQRRRVSMQILSLSYPSLHQITDKLCAAINLWETYTAHCQNCNTSHLSFFLTSCIIFTRFQATAACSFVSAHPRSLHCIMPLYSTQSLSFLNSFSLSASRSGNIFWQAV